MHVLHLLLSPVLAIAMLALAPWLAPAQATAGERPLKVVASFSILGDMVARIGGPAVSVRTLVGPGGDAHVFEPSPSDARAMAEADLVIINGLGFEGWIERLVKASGYAGPLAAASADVRPRSLADAEGHDPHAGHDAHHSEHKTHQDAEGRDPHAWQDIANGRLYVQAITRALTAAAPADAATFAANARAYDAELAELDAWVRQSIAEIPPEKRRVITSHDAFGYLAAAYGIDFLAPVGLSSEAEASAGSLAALIRQLREERIKALFVESIMDPRLIAMLAREAGVPPGEPLYSDALSAPGAGADTYVAMFRHNITTLVAGMRRN